MSMTRIYKYPVMGDGVVNFITCNKVRLLDIQRQGDGLVCWVETSDGMPEVTTNLIGFGTGWDIPTETIGEITYFRTVQDAAGFVWHFYEMPEGILK